MSKEAAPTAQFEFLSQHLPERAEKYHRKQMRILSIPAEIRNDGLLNTNHIRYRLKNLCQ
jgi:hypothetical protein